MIMLPIWLIAWGFFEYVVAMGLIHGCTKGHHWGMTVFLLVWFVGWTFGGVSAIFALSRMFFGRDIIVIANSGIAFKRKDLFFSKAKFYEAENIKAFRLAPEAIAPAGCLLFDYGSETIRMAHRLDYAEAKNLFVQIETTKMINTSEPTAAASPSVGPAKVDGQ